MSHLFVNNRPNLHGAVRAVSQPARYLYFRYKSRLINSRQNESQFAAKVTFVFATIGAWGAYHHEMWRDEHQAWLVARDVPLAKLFQHLHYEGHPSLWYLLLKPLAALGAPVWTMQVLHLAIGVATTYLFTRYARLSRYHRALFIFGYFPIFEYLLICRNYAIGLLTIVLAMIVWPYRRKRPFSIAFVLAAMAHTSAHASVLAVAFLVAFTVDAVFDRELSQYIRRRIWAAVLLAAVGIGLAYVQLQPPPDSGWISEPFTRFDQSRIWTLSRYYLHAMVPIPRDIPHFWESFAVDDYWGEIVRYVPLVVVGIALLAFASTPAVSAFFIAGNIGLCLLFYMYYSGSLRHHGFFFIILVVSVCLRELHQDTCRRNLLATTSRIAQWGMTWLLLGLFFVQVIAGATAVGADLRSVFSPARDTSQYLRDHGFRNLPLYGSMDAIASSVASYLPADQMLYGEGRRLGSYILWDRKRFSTPNGDEMIAVIKSHAKLGKEWIMVLSYALSADVLARYSIQPLADFTGTVDDWEEHLYLYSYRIP